MHIEPSQLLVFDTGGFEDRKDGTDVFTIEISSADEYVEIVLSASTILLRSVAPIEQHVLRIDVDHL